MNGGTVPQQPTRSKANTERAVMGILVGLALKGGLDTAYGKTMPADSAATLPGLLAAVCTQPSVQVFVFLLTLVRFVYGAHRILETVEESSVRLERWTSIWNIVGMLLLFVLFYMTALCILHPVAFYAGLAAVHVWDLLWFIVFTSHSDGLEQQLKMAMRRFMWVDFLTIVLLVPVVIFVPAAKVTHCGLGVMIMMSVLDVWWSFAFFFPPAPQAKAA